MPTDPLCPRGVPGPTVAREIKPTAIFQTTVVDNGFTDGSLEMLRPGFSSVMCEVRLGRTGAPAKEAVAM